jgi:hypothetical protein
VLDDPALIEHGLTDLALVTHDLFVYVPKSVPFPKLMRGLHREIVGFAGNAFEKVEPVCPASLKVRSQKRDVTRPFNQSNLSGQHSTHDPENLYFGAAL